MVSDSYGYKKIEIESKRISSTTSQLHTGFYGVSDHYFTEKLFRQTKKHVYIVFQNTNGDLRLR